MKIGCKTDKGKIKENNEDYCIVEEEIGLFLIADGMGGHKAGEEASKIAAETIKAVIRSKIADNGNNEMTSLIKEAVDHAHNEIRTQAAKKKDLQGMGTTVVLGLWQDNKLYIAHVGDSRAYLINSKMIEPLTEDHSVVASLIKSGEITGKQARKHKMRNVITRCLGQGKTFLGPDINSFEIKPGSVLLLCSDGLNNMLNDNKIKKTVLKNQQDLQRCANELVRLANKKGGKDNITVLLVEIG